MSHHTVLRAHAPAAVPGRTHTSAPTALRTTPRAAVVDDIAEVVRLRSLSFEGTGAHRGGNPSADGGWRDVLAAALHGQIASDTAQVLVVDGGSGLAAFGIGSIEQRLPGPYLATGRVGLVIGIATDPVYRWHGLGLAILRDLLAWFRERGADRVDPLASVEGEPLRRELGFADYCRHAPDWCP
ncbi:GNAT family N-acetyltransferase [Kitasatospora sp. NPDC059648]|uniref:GNAT family N-acetyltransferase n=1 Tax=Kitasatospora sp. NPDC059648 TaxID=3346894 RepID=UPI0036B61FFF